VVIERFGRSAAARWRPGRLKLVAATRR